MNKAMLPVIAKVHLSVHGCYAYYTTAADLNTLDPPVKILTSQISLKSAIHTPIHCKELIYL